MARRVEGATADYHRNWVDSAGRHTQRRSVKLRLFRHGEVVMAGDWRGICGFDLTLLRVYCLRPVSRTRPVRPERAGKNEIRLRRGSADCRYVGARAFDDAVAFRRVLPDLVAAGSNVSGFHWRGAWRAFPQTWQACFCRTAGTHGNSVAAIAGDRLLGSRF